MGEYTQADRPLKITTPLGEDVLLIRSLKGREEISRPFEFNVELIADLEDEVVFDKIVGQSVTVEMRLPDDSKRFFNGVVNRFSQGARDETFLHFSASVVPKLWLLTKMTRSRIFQHLTVTNILKQVLTGFDVSYEISGSYYPRDYCVQYRESDFAFASRLMEEEGIFYYFKHSDGNHQMVVTDISYSHPAVPGASSVVYEEMTGNQREEMRVTRWQKTQELRSGECTLWDYCFELPGNHLEGQEKTIASVSAGRVTHKLNLANDSLEMYDFPGLYAQRFDGVDPSGGDRSSDIQHIFEDRTRTVRLRMEQEEVQGLRIEGAGDCGQFTAGHKFTLERHFDADGAYVLTRVEHDAVAEAYRSDQADTGAFQYTNRFWAIPEALRYRPQRITSKPVIPGMQSATVVGPAGEEIFVDKYGRVKVQFPWDREGSMDADSSCWVRVSQGWAGKGWGAFFWPRIGHEVVVAFEEGDPDQPIIVGRVYHADNMPPFPLPSKKMVSGFKSNSTKGGGGYNEISMDDTKGNELIHVHAQHDQSIVVEHDERTRVGVNRTELVGSNESITIGANRTEQVGNDETISIGVDRTEQVGNSETVTIGVARTTSIGVNDMLNVGTAQEITIGAVQVTTVGQDRFVNVGALQDTQVGEKYKLTAGSEIVLQTGSAKITMKSSGDIEISGTNIKINGVTIDSESSGIQTIKGSMVKINT
ncbi:MAG TPA: type VI secretion system tip protein TssI/VgrG [Bryobacteraceae bacterium]|nr:type VI secretion system tip protein TssI/VgrG [Bryobacteraceae bacterium]